MKIALISFDFGEYCVRLASGLAQRSEVLLFLPKMEVEPYTHLLNGSAALQTFRKPRLRDLIRQIQVTAALVRQIKDFNPDVIHVQSGHLWFSVGLPALGNRPLVLTVHDAVRHLGDKESRRTPDWILDRACFRAQQRIVHAPQVKDVLVQRLRLPSETVHVVPHILVGDETSQADIEEEEQTILFFGRLWEYKGLEYLIRAEPLITSAIPGAKIVIAGRGEDINRYRRMMVNPERFIIHNEHVSDEKRAELFRRASIVVLPYIEASQSGVIPIAYRFGKPVIATTVGGLPAMVDHGKTGYLVPPRDEKALAHASIILLQNRELRRQFGESGRRKVNLECAPDVIARKTELVYRLAMNSHKPDLVGRR